MGCSSSEVDKVGVEKSSQKNILHQYKSQEASNKSNIKIMVKVTQNPNSPKKFMSVKKTAKHGTFNRNPPPKIK